MICIFSLRNFPRTNIAIPYQKGCVSTKTKCCEDEKVQRLLKWGHEDVDEATDGKVRCQGHRRSWILVAGARNGLSRPWSTRGRWCKQVSLFRMKVNQSLAKSENHRTYLLCISISDFFMCTFKRELQRTYVVLSVMVLFQFFLLSNECIMKSF